LRVSQAPSAVTDPISTFGGSWSNSSGGIGAAPIWLPVMSMARKPAHRRIEAERQRAAALERFVIGRPVSGLVNRECRLAHASQLPGWFHEMNPQNRHSRNKATAMGQLISRPNREQTGVNLPERFATITGQRVTIRQIACGLVGPEELGISSGINRLRWRHVDSLPLKTLAKILVW
jgi:hypothetical protein